MELYMTTIKVLSSFISYRTKRRQNEGSNPITKAQILRWKFLSVYFYLDILG